MFDNALRRWDRIEALQFLHSAPVRRCSDALEQACGAEHERPGAHGGGESRRGVDLPQPVEDPSVLEERVGTRAARHDYDVGLRDLVECVVDIQA